MGQNCLICDKVIYRKFKQHLERYHNLSVKEYYDKYLKQDGDDCCKNCGIEVDFMKKGYKYYDFCSQACNCAYTHKNMKKNDPVTYREWHVKAGKEFWNDPIRAKNQCEMISKFQKKHGKLNQVIAEKKKNDPEYVKYMSKVAANNGFGRLHKLNWFKELRKEYASKQSMSQVLDPFNAWGTRRGKLIEYKGNTLRSTWEHKLVVKLDELEIIWEYEKHTFRVPKVGLYTPDFYILHLNLFIEVKPSNFIDSKARRKLSWVKSEGHRVIFLCDENWNEVIEYLSLTRENPKSGESLIHHGGSNDRDLRNSTDAEIMR